MICERCKQTIIMHANGDLACSCDFMNHPPPGPLPAWWDFDADLARAWAESENPSEEVTI